MNNNLAWVKGIIPGQPEWVCETIAAEFDLYDERLAKLRAEIEALRAKIAEARADERQAMAYLSKDIDMERFLDDDEDARKPARRLPRNLRKDVSEGDDSSQQEKNQ